MTADLAPDERATGKPARAAVLAIARKDTLRPTAGAKGSLLDALLSMLEVDRRTVGKAIAGATHQAGRPYARARRLLRDRPLAALGIGASVGLGLGLLLWTGYEFERQPRRG